MKIRNKDLWDEWRANNQDSYGGCVMQFSEAWADRMEALMSDGKPLADVYNAAATEVDRGFGITGAMYGFAVQVLLSCWEHGLELGKLHNREYIKDGEEADAAAERGETVNPSIITVRGNG